MRVRHAQIPAGRGRLAWASLYAIVTAAMTVPRVKRSWEHRRQRMGDRQIHTLDRIFRALSSEPRRKILRLAARERCAVTQLAAHLKISQPAVSKHIRVLVDAGLLSKAQRDDTAGAVSTPAPLNRHGRSSRSSGPSIQVPDDSG
jgi:DNA-binding transcriptional ArsR family regulator